MNFELFKQQLEQQEENRKQAKAKYMKANLDKKHEWDKAYREAHKEQRKEYNKQYQEEHKNKLTIKNKQYKETHNDQIMQYRLDNKSKLAARAATKIKCECGITHRLGNILRHKRTIHHQSWEEVLKN